MLIKVLFLVHVVLLWISFMWSLKVLAKSLNLILTSGQEPWWMIDIPNHCCTTGILTGHIISLCPHQVHCMREEAFLFSHRGRTFSAIVFTDALVQNVFSCSTECRQVIKWSKKKGLCECGSKITAAVTLVTNTNTNTTDNYR